MRSVYIYSRNRVYQEVHILEKAYAKILYMYYFENVPVLIIIVYNKNIDFYLKSPN